MEAVTAAGPAPCRARLARVACVLWLLMPGGSAGTVLADAGSTRVVTAVIPRDSPPDYQLDDAGNPGGFAIETMALIARQAGVEVRYRIEDNWDAAIESLRAGRADLIPNLGVTPEREREFAFTAPVETTRISLFVRRDTSTVSGLADLAGRKIAVVRANAAEALLRARPEIQLSVYSDFQGALFALLSGNVDALAYPEPWTWNRARAARVANNIKVVGEPLVELKRGLAVRAGDAALLAQLAPAVDQVLAGPEYRATYARWMGTSVQFWSATRVTWTMGAVLLVAIGAMGAWRYTATARLNRELRGERDFIGAVLDTIGSIVVVLDRDGRIVRFNRACERVTGYTAGEALGRRVWDFLLPPEQIEPVTAVFATLSAGQFPNTYENDWLTRDGARRTIAWSNSALVDARGQVEYVIATGIDITERKQAEELRDEAAMRQRAIIIASPVPKALNDEQGNIVFLNPAFTVTFGYTREDIPTLADWWPKAYPDPEYRRWVAGTWQTTMDKCQREGTAFPPIELNIRCKDGTVKTVLASAAPFGKSFAGVHLVVMYDITERKHAEAEREQLLAELTARNAEMENFVYTISHDLKSPLITIGGFSSLLEKDIARGDRAAVADSVAEIKKAVGQMQDHIRDLLLLSRTGRALAERTVVPLGALLDEVAGQFNPRIVADGATLTFAADLPAVEVDRSGFARVFTNLIDNALKYRRPGVAPRIEVGWQRGGDELRLFVRDNGSGIKPEFQPRIFGLFQRADSRTEGTGVGLAISKRVVEVHGGRMWVESGPGEGSTFWIALPASLVVSA